MDCMAVGKVLTTKRDRLTTALSLRREEVQSLWKLEVFLGAGRSSAVESALFIVQASISGEAAEFYRTGASLRYKPSRVVAESARRGLVPRRVFCFRELAQNGFGRDFVLS